MSDLVERARELVEEELETSREELLNAINAAQGANEGDNRDKALRLVEQLERRFNSWLAHDKDFKEHKEVEVARYPAKFSGGKKSDPDTIVKGCVICRYDYAYPCSFIVSKSKILLGENNGN